MYKQILVATDGSKLSSKAVTHAISLAQAVGAGLTAFYASPDYPLPAYADGVVYEPVSKKEYTALATKEAEKILEAVAEKADGRRREVHDVALRSRPRRGKRSSPPPRRPRPMRS